jgi:hypothetical protein
MESRLEGVNRRSLKKFILQTLKQIVRNTPSVGQYLAESNNVRLGQTLSGWPEQCPAEGIG